MEEEAKQYGKILPEPPSVQQAGFNCKFISVKESELREGKLNTIPLVVKRKGIKIIK